MAKIKKYAAHIIATVFLLIAVIAGTLFSGIAAGAESMDKLRTDFRENGNGWTLNSFAAVSSSQGLQLLPGGRAETVDTMDGSLLFIEFGAVGTGFTLELGVSEGEAAVSLRFDGGVLCAEGLEDASGQTDAVLARSLGESSILKIEMIAGYVEIYIKNADGNYDSDLGTPLVTLYYPEDTASREGGIALTNASDASSPVVVRTADLYSLDGSVFIETEDAPEENEEPADTGDKGNALPWWGIMLIVIGGVLVLAAAAVAVVFVIKKKKSAPEDDNGGEGDDDEEDR